MKSTSMKNRILPIAAIFVALLAILVAWGPLTGLPATAAAGLSWQAYDTGLEQARASRKPILVQVYAEWCQECHRLEQDMQSDARINSLLQRNFVLVRVNLGSEQQVRYQGKLISEKQLAGRLQATWPPMLLFYSPEGKLIGRKFGYTPPEQLQQLLEYVASGKAGQR